jgi:hypothetical protein
VSSAHEFYDYADEHFGWAETAKTERERAIFLQMAAAWLEVAQQWEAMGWGRHGEACTVRTLVSRRRLCWLPKRDSFCPSATARRTKAQG